jgi:hypothetical protein
MNKIIIFFLLNILSNSLLAQELDTKKATINYFGKAHFLIEGSGIPESEKESPYDRLPITSKEKVRKAVWDLSKNSAGITLRFISNSSQIKIKWDLLNDTRMNHMAEGD